MQGNGQFANDSQGHERMSSSDPRTGTFYQTRGTKGDTTCSVKVVLEEQPVKSNHFLSFPALLRLDYLAKGFKQYWRCRALSGVCAPLVLLFSCFYYI